VLLLFLFFLPNILFLLVSVRLTFQVKHVSILLKHVFFTCKCFCHRTNSMKALKECKEGMSLKNLMVMIIMMMAVLKCVFLLLYSSN